jgi:hypothetical protein
VSSAPLAPRRGAVCVDCRTLLRAGERCDGGVSHRVASLETPEGRARLLDEVWGPPSARRRARQLAKAGGSSAGIGSALQGCDACSGCSGLDPEALVIGLIVVAAALVGMAIYWAIVKIVEHVRARRNRLKPHGGLLRPASLGRRAGPAGVVIGPATLEAPASRAGCVAYAIDLRCTRFLRADLMMHDAETSGFEVRLDDGGIARVPAGRLRIEGRVARRARSAAPELDQHVQALCPRAPEPDDYDPFPYDTVDEILVRPGDRIRLFGALERLADPEAPAAYREGARGILVPRGVPAIRVEAEAEAAG